MRKATGKKIFTAELPNSDEKITSKKGSSAFLSSMIKIRFKKFLICEMAQITLEYFLLFTVIALFTVVGVSKFLPEHQKTFENMQTKALSRVAANQQDPKINSSNHNHHQ